jgi:SAM-dependent methyltransferase/uncharacterized protein YbaR (Trm112 family)
LEGNGLRLGHFEALAPICPRCRYLLARRTPLRLAEVTRASADGVLEGRLACDDADCGQDYPILDGAPILVPDVRLWVAGNLIHMTLRDDLDGPSEALLSEAAGAGNVLDTWRQLVSSYAWDHYAAADPEETVAAEAACRPGRAMAALDHGLDLLGQLPDGPLLDLGCATGGTTFGLAARSGRLVVGVDTGPALLRTARRVLRERRIAYPRRRIGLVFDRRSFALSLPGADLVDFWICDATALPFDTGLFAGMAALNVLDCVADPPALLAEMGRVLAVGGGAVLTCPYDWSSQATLTENWLGGQSSTDVRGGAAEPLVHALLGGDHPRAVAGLTVVAEERSWPWRVRLHDRSAMVYDTHLLALRRTAVDPSGAADTATTAGCGCPGGHR